VRVLQQVIRGFAGVLAANRTLFGLGYLIAPDRMGEAWVGRKAGAEQVQVLTRALGARDLVLGVGALAAMRTRDGSERGWFAAHTVADGTDLVATIIARKRLPAKSFRFALGMAGASTAIAALGAAQPAVAAEK